MTNKKIQQYQAKRNPVECKYVEAELKPELQVKQISERIHQNIFGMGRERARGETKSSNMWNP